MELMNWVMAVRFVMTAMSAFLMGFTFFVAAKYMRLYARSPRDWRRMLPLHVWTIALSYNLLLVYATIEVYIKIGAGGHTPTWRAPMLLTAYGLGIVAMHVINRLQRVRINPARHEDL